MLRFTFMLFLSSSLIVGIGCTGGNSDYKKTTELKKAPAHDEHDHDHDHGHGEKGPHGGSLVELGEEEYHAEVVVDHDAHAVRVFILGKDGKTAAPTTAKEVTLTPEGKDALTLKAAPQEGDGEGKSSKFELVDEAVVHGFFDAGMIHAQLNVAVDDKSFSGHVDYHLDDAHDHDHKDEKAAGGAKANEAKPDAKDAKPEEPAKATDAK